MNDSRIIAYDSPWTGKHHILFDLHDLPLGSNERCARVDEMDRFIEALKGQGCAVSVYSLDIWARGMRENFYKRKTTC